MYSDYQFSRDASWELLLNRRLTSLPIKITEICQQLNIELRTFRNINPVQSQRNQRSRGKVDGYTRLMPDGQPLIVYDSNDPPARCRFTIAHELGHVLLGHLGSVPFDGIWTVGMYRRMEQPATPQEHQANIFASRLLAPACVLWGLGVKTAADIQYFCNISAEAAKYRMLRLQLLYDRDKRLRAQKGRGCFLMSEMEQKVYKQFQPFIEANRL